MTLTAPEIGLPTEVTLSLGGLTAADVVAVARYDAKVAVAPAALAEVARVRAHVEELAASETPAYGISTGFGALANRHIPQELRTQLQKSLIRSHAAGMGPAVEREVVRALMLLRAKTLASGRTGVRPVVLETFVKLLNAGITPLVREFGSLGCSGDLAPLSHVALVLMGEGEAVGPDGEVFGGRGQRTTAELLAEHGVEPVTLAEKEGLALVNGTEGMLGMLLMALHDLDALVKTADVTAALSVDGLMGTDQVFLPELHAPLRPHPGQADSAANMLAVLRGSKIVESH
jgi:histidine ammonia-lyase